DFGNELAFAHFLAKLHLQRLELSRCLRAHAHQLVCLDGACRQYAVLEIAAHGVGGGELRRGGGAEEEDLDGDRGCNQHGDNQQVAKEFFLGRFHAIASGVADGWTAVKMPRAPKREAGSPRHGAKTSATWRW